MINVFSKEYRDQLRFRFEDVFRTWPTLFKSEPVRTVHKLQGEFPYIDIEDRFLWDKFGCVHAFYEIHAPCTDVTSVEYLTRIQQLINRLVKNLPENIVQIDWCLTTNGDYSKFLYKHLQFQSESSILQHLRELRFHRLSKDVMDRKIVKSSTMLVLTCSPTAVSNEKGDILRDILPQGTPKIIRTKRLSQAEFDEAVHLLRTSELPMMEGLKQLGIEMQPIVDFDICQFFYNLMNQDQAFDVGIPLEYNPETESFYNTWALADGEIKHNCFQWGDYFHAVVAIGGVPFGPPRFTEPRIIEDILTRDLPFNDFRVSLKIRRLDQEAEKRSLRLQRGRAADDTRQSLSMVDQLGLKGKNAAADSTGRFNTEALNELGAVGDLLDILQEQKDYLVSIQFVVHLWATDRAELIKRRNLMAARIAKMNSAKPYREMHGTVPTFINSMPAVFKPFEHPNKVLGNMAVDLIPLNRGYGGGSSPVAIYRNANRGLAGFNLFDKTLSDVAIAFVCGSTGSGKSSFVQSLILQHLLEKTILIIIDVGGSFQALVEVLGGKTITFDKDNPICVNPFQLHSSSGKLTMPDAAMMTKIINCVSILALRTEDKGMLPDKMVRALGVAIEQAYYHGIKDGLTLITLSDLDRALQELEGRPEVGELRERLYRVTHGDYRHHFNGPGQLHVDSRIFSADLKGMDRDPVLLSMMAPLLISYAEGLIYEWPDWKKLLVLDELFKLLSSKWIADFVLMMLKQIRKENGGIIVSTQQMKEEAMSQGVFEAIRQSVFYWFLLRQGDDQVDFVTTALRLTDAQTTLLRELKKVDAKQAASEGKPYPYREVLVVTGENRVSQSGKIEVSYMPEETWLLTNDPQEKNVRREAVKQCGGDLVQAISLLAAKYPSGYHAAQSQN